MRFRYRNLLWLALPLGVVAAACVGVGVGRYFDELGENIRDVYCQSWAAASILKHVDDHDGRYPRNWDELRPSFDKVTEGNPPFPFEEVRARTIVDFDVDVANPPMRFVSLASGRNVGWGDLENQQIRERLLKK